MKANELMIRDWVLFDHNPVRVAILGAAQDSLGLAVGDNVFGQPYSMIEPIPLTAEILEKNEFKYDELPKFAVNEITEKTKMTFSYHSGSRTVFVGVNEPNFNLTSACVLYVHELQHILRQSRIEKEIIL